MIAESVDMMAAMYEPMFEQAQDESAQWEKMTVKYVMEHMKGIRGKIRSEVRARIRREPQEFDVDDIYQDVLMYFLGARDYNPLYGAGPEIVPLEGYVSNGIKNCVKRFYLNDEPEVSLNSPVGDDEAGDEMIDFVQDEQGNKGFERSECNLQAALKGCQYLRSRFGCDLYTVLYIVLRTGKRHSQKEDVLQLLGGTRDKLEQIKREAEKPDSELKWLVEAIAYEGETYGIEYVETEIRAYVPAADMVDAALEL